MEGEVFLCVNFIMNVDDIIERFAKENIINGCIDLVP